MRNPIHHIISGALAGLLLLLPAAVMAAPVNDTFDHFTTGFSLTGGHRAVECDACHTAGQFRGTPRECASCHNLLMNTGAVVKSSAHIQTSNDCQTCHSTLAWDDVRRVNHMAVLGDCKSCHSIGGAATSRPPSDTIHTSVISNGTDCITCHRTSTWMSVHYNHTANIGTHNCNDCHFSSTRNNGIPATRPPTGDLHDASTITSRSLDCNMCHNTHSWRFSHSSTTGTCSSCHDNASTYGTAITQKPAGIHLLTALECNSCHSTRAWIPAGWNHTGPYPNHTFTRLGCNDCHSSSPQSATNAYDNQTYAPYCLACHESDARKEHSVSTKYQDCQSCHEHSNALSRGKW